MIDTIESCDEKEFKTTFEVLDSNPLYIDGQLSESAMTENVAQTCAAGFGYLKSQLNQKSDGLGFIGAVSKLKVYGWPKAGQSLNTTVSVLNEFENIHLIQGQVFVEGELQLECQMKIVST